jgi:hypothetical protein
LVIRKPVAAISNLRFQNFIPQNSALKTQNRKFILHTSTVLLFLSLLP